MQQVCPVLRQFVVPARQVADHVLEDGDSVFVLGEKPEVRPDPQMAAVLAENVGREGVKGAEQRPVRVLPQAPLHPVPHLGGGLVGGSQRDDRSALVLFKQPYDADGEHCGLAGTGPGEHE